MSLLPPANDPAEFLRWLKASGDGRCVTHVERIPAKAARHADWPSGLDERLVNLFAARGIRRPYTHQTAAISRVQAGKSVVVVTPTASGKTLCYNVPTLDLMLKDPQARAIYLFPTKALAQDQMTELHSLIEALGADIKTFTYDGDTPANARKAVRLAGNIVVTNPDMLHTGILPHHTKWHRLFSQLRYIVVDEMHTYRGLFGSHVANVIRRLLRVCAHYGAHPQLILCSATIANPRELAEKLTGEPVELIGESGAPTNEKNFVFYNPPVVNRQLGIRAGSLLTARRIASKLIVGGTRTIVFAKSRVSVEVLLTYLRDDVQAARKPADWVRGYRGGYLPLQRREIEAGLRDGSVRGVVSTNALELGIDIGGLDACVMVGYPGTVAATWQQAGRSGRRSDGSLAVMVASSSPLDQYIVSHPDYFFGRTAESGLVNPDNLYVLVSHVKCAAFELPFKQGESFGQEPVSEVLGYLGENGVLHEAGGQWHWNEDAFPAESISLRSAAAENVVIIDQTEAARPVVIGEMDRLGATTMLHDQAIYLHEGRQYEVVKLDWQMLKAYVRRVNVDYYTDADLAVKLTVLDEFAATSLPPPPPIPRGGRGETGSQKAWGEVSLTVLATIFKKIKLNTHENVGWGKIHLPEDNTHTTAYWLALPNSVGDALSPVELQEGLLGLAHVLAHVAPLYLMCDPRDLGVHPEIKAPHTGRPTVFIYDNVPGGIGFAERLYNLHDELLRAAGDLIADCACEAGCPSCVGVPTEPKLNGKALTRQLLAVLA